MLKQQCLSREVKTLRVLLVTYVENYKLNIISRNIHDIQNNTTRFLIIGNMEVDQSKNDKTSFVMSLDNKAGALSKALDILAKNKISMTKIESIPTKEKNWEYLFLIDISGHIKSNHIAGALKKIMRISKYFQLIGFLSKEYRLVSSNNISRYSPGFNINDVQRKYKIKKIVKLSSNENPFISDKVSKYISKHNHDINLYPESKTSHLQALIAKTIGYKLNGNNILLGNGSNEILEFIVRDTLDTKSEVIIPKHSFLVYEIISQLQGARVITSNPDKDKASPNYMGIDLQSIRQRLQRKLV